MYAVTTVTIRMCYVWL